MNKRVKKKHEDQKKRTEAKNLKEFCKTIKRLTKQRVFTMSSVPSGNQLLDETVAKMKNSIQELLGPEYKIELEKPFTSSVLIDFHDAPIEGRAIKKGPVKFDIKIVKYRKRDEE